MSDPIIMASASWCGFSKKFEAQIKDEKKEKSFEVIHCDKDEKHPACVGVSGFPTFKKKLTVKGKSGEGGADEFKECKVGFAATGEVEKSCA